jgi:hypothetical protein
MMNPQLGTPATGRPPATALAGDKPLLIDTSRPHPARRYDYWLGGKDSFDADRASADQIAAAFPHIRTAVLENRRFLHRAVAFLSAAAGIRQFLDIGTGIPTSPNVQELAQLIAPAARVAYVDNDPMVVAHGRGRTASTPEGAVTYIQADLRKPGTILDNPALTSTLDLTQPVALLLIAVLHFLGDRDDPYGAVADLIAALPPGSFVAVSHATFDPLPAATIKRLAPLIEPGAGHGLFRPRSRDEVARFLNGLELVDPGLVPAVQWRPNNAPKPEASVEDSIAYAAVAGIGPEPITVHKGLPGTGIKW